MYVAAKQSLQLFVKMLLLCSTVTFTIWRVSVRCHFRQRRFSLRLSSFFCLNKHGFILLNGYVNMRTLIQSTWGLTSHTLIHSLMSVRHLQSASLGKGSILGLASCPRTYGQEEISEWAILPPEPRLPVELNPTLIKAFNCITMVAFNDTCRSRLHTVCVQHKIPRTDKDLQTQLSPFWAPLFLRLDVM